MNQYKAKPRFYVIGNEEIDCPSCDGFSPCFDCDGEGKILPTFWDGDFVKHKHQDLEGWIVGFDGCKAIVEINDDDEDETTQLIYRVEELEHAKEE